MKTTGKTIDFLNTLMVSMY